MHSTLNRLGECATCYASADLMTMANMNAINPYAFRPYEPTPEPWVPNVSEFDLLPGVGEYGDRLP